jgi:hypothetical protein
MIMLGIMMKLTFAPLVALLLSGCASTLTNPGQHVEIAPEAPSASRYLDIGEIVAAEPYDFRGDEDNCKDLIRDYAGRDGADIVVIKTKKRSPCETDANRSCVSMRAEAYRTL